MFNRFWLAAFESWAVLQLLRSPSFHRAVRGMHKQINRVRHGTPLEEMGGTKREGPEARTFVKYFLEEVKEQAGLKKGGKR